MREIEDLEKFLAQHRPEWSVVRWINVAGLSDMTVVHALATKYEFHPLAIEDLLQVTQRPKVERYGGDDSEMRARSFVIVRMVQIKEERLHSEHISLFLGHKTVLMFQERQGDVWDAIRQRLNVKGSCLRKNDARFLMYSLTGRYCRPLLLDSGRRWRTLGGARKPRT